MGHPHVSFVGCTVRHRGKGGPPAGKCVNAGCSPSLSVHQDLGNGQWWKAFVHSLFTQFSLKSARQQDETFSQCVSRVRAAGGPATGVVDATSGVGLANAVLTTSVGTTTWSVTRGVPPRQWNVTQPNLSLLESASNWALGNGLISPGLASGIGKFASGTAKLSGMAAAVGLGLEGGILAACR